MRNIIDFDSGWLFHLGDTDDRIPASKMPIYMQSKTERMKWGPACKDYFAIPDDSGLNHEYSRDKWQYVSLPHDYIIGGIPKEENNNALGFFDYNNAWYRKEFNISEELKGKRITLQFDGVATFCTVYLNGCLVGRNFCGYTPFEIDITDFADYGNKNVLAVYVDGTHYEGWWYNGAGIYRHVHMIVTEKLCIEQWGVFHYAVKISESTWKIKFKTELLNLNDCDKVAYVKSTIRSQSGTFIAETGGKVDIKARSNAVIEYETIVENPHLWDIDDPYMYDVETTVTDEQNPCDSVHTRLGIREYYFDPDKGLILNGRHVKIKGVCAHEDCGLSGKAVPDNIHRYKISLIKEMGANGYRTSHYPQSEYIMDALDENGFIVMDETRWFDSSKEGLYQLETLIKRDRNRPSVFFWSVGNEEPYHTIPAGAEIYKTMAALVKKLDPTRPVTTAVSNSPDTACVQQFVDIIGVNYCPETLEALHEKFPAKAIFSSENCATGTTRGWYYDKDENRAFLPAYDGNSDGNFYSREFYWKLISSHDWIAGGYQWIAFEHRGEAVWPRLCSQSGAIDLYLQKKDAFYQNRSHWIEDKPVIHIMPHWNFRGREGEIITVCAYTNCEEAELFLNGTSLGKKKVEKYTKLQWQVTYEPGEIRVIGYIDGKEAVSDSSITSDMPYALKLRLDNDPLDITANGKDGAVITAYCVDKNGIEVPDAALEKIRFSTNSYGKVFSTGSDITDHSSLLSPDRSMRAGKTTALVIAGTKKGTLKVFAECSGLISASLSIELK